MDALWRARGLDLRLSPYGCVATARHQGFIEVVPNASTLSEITRDERFRKGAPLLKSVRNSAQIKFRGASLKDIVASTAASSPNARLTG